jgi:6-phosphogluconolactonase
MTIERFDSAGAMAKAAADFAAESLARGLSTSGQALFVATGGRTAGGVYDQLAQAPLDWSRITVKLTDERWVAVDDPDSNEGLVRSRLLQCEAAKARLIGLRGKAKTLQDAADEACIRLEGLAAPDVALVGMGEDGHIASLFPGNPALALGLDPAAPACIVVPRGTGRPPPQDRLSLSAAWLTRARLILIVINGAAKLRVAQLALSGTDDSEFPVRSILKRGPGVVILWSA